jgi:methylglutaconyl-CoA hydratase
MTQLTRFSQRAGVDYLALASTHNRNALSIRLTEELLEAIAASRGRALVLEHEGPVFCAGVDLRERSAEGADQRRHSALLIELLRALVDVPHPVICRIDGPVRGGGMGLVACADIAIASPAASFAFSEVRVGVLPAIVGGLALRKVAPGPLMPLLLSGRQFSAEEALRIGLLSVVETDTPAAVDAYCTEIKAGAPGAIAATKALMHSLTDTRPLAEMLHALDLKSAEQFATAEGHEGMTAFLERRTPAWTVGPDAS